MKVKRLLGMEGREMRMGRVGDDEVTRARRERGAVREAIRDRGRRMQLLGRKQQQREMI